MENARMPKSENGFGAYFGSMMVMFFYEFVGTALLVIAVNATGGNAVGIGLTLFFLLLLGAPITGALYNPAVALGVFINKPMSANQFGMMCWWILAEILGGLFGMGICYAAMQNDELPTEAKAAAFPHLTPNTNERWQSVMFELFGTYIFVMANLLCKDTRAG